MRWGNTGDDAGPSSRGPNGYSDRGGDDGTLAMGWGSGTANFPYLITPLEAVQGRARQDGSAVSWFLDNWDLSGAAATAVDPETTARARRETSLRSMGVRRSAKSE